MPQFTENSRMFAEVYDELRRIARRYYFHNAADHTLQPTALVNEAFTKIVRQRNVDPSNRSQFLGVAAVILKNKLIDNQKKKKALKHGGGAVRVELDDNIGREDPLDVDFIAIHRAIDRLKSVHERRAQVVELRYWLGMKNEEIADALGISLATVKTDWTIAKAFLHRELEGEEAGDVDA